MDTAGVGAPYSLASRDLGGMRVSQGPVEGARKGCRSVKAF